jgi:4-oxalocrotonate tautomerase
MISSGAKKASAMPVIRIEMFEGRTEEQKGRFASAATKAFVEHCGGTAASVQIIFTDVSRTNWATGGKLNSEKPD